MVTTVQDVPLYSGIAPNRLNQEQAEFSANSDDSLLYQSTLADNMNASIDDMNTLGGEMTQLGVDSAASASASEASAGESASSALISSSNANFVGKWVDQSGAANIPYSVWNDGNNWQLLTNLANVTVSEPASDNADWQIIITPALTAPDVSISFNDGITIDKGYGTVDANGNRAIDFTRASATGNINKSGVSVDLVTDEAAITSDGLSVYESFDNELLWSEDFSQADWLKSNSSVLLVSGFYELTDDATSGAHQISQVEGVSQADPIRLYFDVKKGTESEVYLIVTFVGVGSKGFIFNFDTETVVGLNESGVTAPDEFSFKAMNGGVYRISMLHDPLSAYTQWQAKVGIYKGGLSYIGGSGTTLLRNAQLTKTSFVAPYIKTTTVPVTRAVDIASIPMMNNMPAPGKPFTIVCDCEIPTPKSGNNAALGYSESLSVFGLRRFLSGKVNFAFFGVNAEDSAVSSSGVNRYAAVYDGVTGGLYENGSLLVSVIAGAPSFDTTKSILIGRQSNGEKLNSEIKNFKIYHSALSDAEIAALGGPK